MFATQSAWSLAERGSHDDDVLVWDPLDAEEGHLLTGHAGAATSVAFGASADGRSLLAPGSQDRTVRVWDPLTGSMAIDPLTGHEARGHRGVVRPGP